MKHPIPDFTKGSEVQHEGPGPVGAHGYELQAASVCCGIVRNQSNMKCDYVAPPVKKLLLKKDEHGNYLVQVNEDGVWRGATFNEETMTLTYKY